MRQSQTVILIDPEVLGVTPVFRGTRVPIRSLFDHCEGGDFLAATFPGYALATSQLTRVTRAAISIY
jgi:uncharacterized protein (DUF433 family)